MKVQNTQLYRLLLKLYGRYYNRFLPRWYVLVFDILVIFFLFFLAYAIRLNFKLAEMPMDVVSVRAVFTIMVYSVFMFVFRSFSGIIRHTGLHEIARVLQALGFSFMALILLTALADLFHYPISFFPRYAVLLIHFLLSFFVLTGARLVIKTIFHRLVRANIKLKRRVIIFGAGSAGMVTRSALMQDSLINYQVMAFVDDNPGKTRKMLDGIPVMLPEKVFNNLFINESRADQLIIAVQNLSIDRRKDLIEKGLEYQLEVKVMPPVRDWINGKLSTSQLRRARIEELLERPPIRLGVEHVARELEGKVVLITGAAGSIGSGLVRQVITYKPRKLVLLDQAESALYDLQFEINQSPELKPYAERAEYVVGSIRDQHRMEKLFYTFSPEVIYHAAAYKHVPMMEDNPYEAVSVNVFGTHILADLAIKYKAKKFVMVSTDKAVNPTNVMGASKRIAEIYVQSMEEGGTQFVTTRFGNVLDSNGSVIPLFRKQIEQGGPVTITHTEITRYFMMIPEACSLVLEAGTMGNGGEIFVFDMGEPVKISHLAEKMIQLSGYVPNQDILIKEIGLRPGEKLFEELLNNNENTLPTHHPKILRARVTIYSRSEVLNHLKELDRILKTGDNFALVEEMKKMVPEFISNNSIYEVLDEKFEPLE
ncbi:MAG: nucleoside-diphosphate sugar epimerase/dehydratase [Bacteroides sp.]|nr:nucleoside-diphosphate sugar epimerase/dehydratase [Bacteroides sp.]